jgi:hypothetical protein
VQLLHGLEFLRRLQATSKIAEFRHLVFGESRFSNKVHNAVTTDAWSVAVI